ncbi:MAG: hypothetical protein OEW05_04540 [Candidatus Aminicenantes bacterium]|nr:hypothetical protein [Candidatus Aminicenantes bacterium]
MGSGPRMSRTLIIGLLIALFTGMPLPGAAQPDVPRAYARLYNLLDRQLTFVERHFSRRGPSMSTTLYTPELLSANSNQGEVLLRPQAFQGSLLLLRRFKEMGFKAVWVSLDYPMLLPEFPRAAEYLDFYKHIAAAARAQGLDVCVDLGTFFPPGVFSKVSWDYSRETIQSFSRKARQQVELILRELMPHFLGIFNEPDTQSKNTGLDFNVANLRTFARIVLDGLDRGRTRIGLGAGTWSPLEVFEMVASDTEVDFLDLHLYPISGDLMTDKIDRIAALAARHGKRLVFGESWLYKAGPGELQGNIAAWDKIFARDVFDFWEPLDERFIAALTRICRAHDAAYCNFFWSQYFFAYVPYGPATAGLPPDKLFALARENAARNILSGTYSGLGEAVIGLLRRSSR